MFRRAISFYSWGYILCFQVVRTQISWGHLDTPAVNVWTSGFEGCNETKLTVGNTCNIILKLSLNWEGELKLNCRLVLFRLWKCFRFFQAGLVDFWSHRVQNGSGLATPLTSWYWRPLWRDKSTGRAYTDISHNLVPGVTCAALPARPLQAAKVLVIQTDQHCLHDLCKPLKCW